MRASTVQWYVINILTFAGLVAGYGYGIVGAGYCALFLFRLSFVLVLSAVHYPSVREILHTGMSMRGGPSVSKGTAVAADAILLFTLVWFGAFFTAIAHIITSINTYSLLYDEESSTNGDHNENK